MSERTPQLAYSELEKRTSDESARLAKAAKIAAVLGHFLGRDDLEGMDLLDIGCSVGIISGGLAARGANVTGVDIDEPGLAKARARHGKGIRFLRGDGNGCRSRMPAWTSLSSTTSTSTSWTRPDRSLRSCVYSNRAVSYTSLSATASL